MKETYIAPMYIKAMRLIASTGARTTSDCQHIIRKLCGESEQYCFSEIFSHGYIRTNGMFIEIDESKRHEWSE